MAQELEIFPYASAQAFGAALTNRLGVLAGNASPSVSQLRRQFAYDRLLARRSSRPITAGLVPDSAILSISS